MVSRAILVLARVLVALKKQLERLCNLLSHEYLSQLAGEDTYVHL